MDVRKINHIKIDVWTEDGVHKHIDTDSMHKANEFWNILKGGMMTK